MINLYINEIITHYQIIKFSSNSKVLWLIILIDFYLETMIIFKYGYSSLLFFLLYETLTSSTFNNSLKKNNYLLMDMLVIHGSFIFYLVTHLKLGNYFKSRLHPFLTIKNRKINFYYFLIFYFSAHYS